MVLVAFIIGVLTAITQYFKYKSTGAGYTLKKKIAFCPHYWPLLLQLCWLFLSAYLYKHGAGFFGALYIALFASVYAAVANAAYIWVGLNGKIKAPAAL